MSSLIQEHLDSIQNLEQQRRREINEKAELARRSVELSIQRCQTELGITDPLIASAIAREVLEAEEAERQQMASVRLLWRERKRLMETGGQPLPDQIVDAARRIQDKSRELSAAQVALSQGQQERRDTLRRYINLCRVEFPRLEGRQRAITLLTGLARERAANPRFNGVGHLVPWAASFIRVGEADDYLTLHNPAYPRGPVARDLAPYFRNIKAQGKNIAIRALKHSHGQAYAGMMGDRNELSCSRLEPDLFRSDSTVKRQPVTARIRELAGDAGHGRGYALAVQGHGDDGPFHGIASYNNISDVSPNNFFGTDNLGDEACRMVDFNFQLTSGKLPMEKEVEVGTLLIEIARFSFGARLFRSECSPLNTRYIDIMAGMGLSRFQAIEPASYNSNLAASTWKFDLCAWKSTEDQLRFQRRWFVLKDTMQEDPEAASRMHDDPEEPLPGLAVLQVEPTIFEDPAAFEPMEQPAQSASHLNDGPVHWTQGSESMEWSSSGSYLTSTTPTNDSGTSSGLGYSDSAPSRSTSSTFHDHSHTGSSSASSVPRPLEASGPFRVGDESAPASGQEKKTLVWHGSAAMKALRDEEASRAMPPPKLPRRLALPSQQSSSSKSSVTADCSDTTGASMETDSQPSTSYDPKGKRPSSASRIGQPGPSTEAERPSQTLQAQEGELSGSEFWPTPETWPGPEPWKTDEPWLASDAWPDPTDPDMEEVSHALVLYDRKGKRPASDPCPSPADPGMEETNSLVPYDRKGKRPASVSWDTQPRRLSPQHQSLAAEGTTIASVEPTRLSVIHREPPQSLFAALDAVSPQTTRSNRSALNQQPPSPNCASNQVTNAEPAHFSPSLSHTQPTAHSPQSPMAWQESQSSWWNGSSAASTPSIPHDRSPSYTVEVNTSSATPAWAPRTDQRRSSGASNEPAVYNLLSTHLAEAPQSSTESSSSGTYTGWSEDATRSQTEALSVTSEVGSTIPQWSAFDTNSFQAGSSHLHHAAPRPQAVATHPRTQRRHVPETVPNILRFENPAESQPQMGTVHASLPVTGFEQSQQQQTAHARQLGLSTQLNRNSDFARQQAPEHYNLALYNYVEFVEEKISEQARFSRTQAALPAEPRDSFSNKGRRPKQPETDGPSIDKKTGRRIAGSKGPARGVSKPLQKGLNGARQSGVTNTKKVVNSQQNTTRVAPDSHGQPGPSSSAKSSPPQDKSQGRRTSSASKPTSVSQKTTAQRTTSLDTLLSNIALAPESRVASMSNRPFRASASSPTHPAGDGDGRPSPAGNDRESSTSWDLPPQQAARQVDPQQSVPQQAASSQVAPQQAMPQPATLPHTTCRLENQTNGKAKQRPWQL